MPSIAGIVKTGSDSEEKMAEANTHGCMNREKIVRCCKRVDLLASTGLR